MMGRNVHPGAFAPDFVWDFVDPTGKSIIHYRVQRDAIRQAVQELIARLSRQQLEAGTGMEIEKHPTDKEISIQMLTRSRLERMQDRTSLYDDAKYGLTEHSKNRY